MKTTGASAGRQPKASGRLRTDASKAFNSLTAMGATEAVPLVNRLHLKWQPVPAAKLYSPSLMQLPQTRNNRSSRLPTSSNKQILSPIEVPKSAGRKLSQSTSTALTAFELKYATEDSLMRYVLHVIRTGCPVRRSEIPRGKHIQRRVRPEEDVLYLVHCRTPPCGFRNVYWLVFVDEGTILRNDHTSSLEYFTLGSHGFTRFKGGQGVEFSDLAGWVDEKRAFDHMTNMKGLKRIQQMIFFFSWKRQAVQRRLHRVRERLASSLFTCHPIAGHLLMDVRDVCAEIERETEREYVETDTSYTLERLAHIHRERVRTAKTAIAQRIYSLCTAIDDATRDISRYKEDQACSYAITDHEAFSKTLRLSSLRDRMFTFLRLVDCHIAEAVYQHVTLFVRDLCVRICGQPVLNRDDLDIAHSRNLCRSELANGAILSAQRCQHVSYTIRDQESDLLVVAVPGLYVSLEDDVDFEGDVNSATMHFVPAKNEVLGLVHTILMNYCVAMDGLPRVLTDKHFQRVLTPFVPSIRREFADSLLKPSHLVLESYEPELREMRAAVDLHFRRIGILQQEHLRCVRAIKVAERESLVETTSRDSITEIDESDEEDSRLPELPDLSSSAAAYELAQKTWNRFVQYANNAAPMLQVGYLLLDQRSFVDRLRSHVSKRMAEMDDALPLIYHKFLTSLLEDVDGRIEKVTKIPANLAEANMWLAQVTSMMPTHPFRQRLDTKIANLARLRVLIRERGLISLELEMQDSIRNLELTWESVIETLLMCLARVEERGSEHRRSVHDVITKVDEYITSQLQLIIKTFEELPSGCEEEDECEEVTSISAVHADTSTKEDMVQQLEDLVTMDIERKNVVLQFEEYDREHRAIMDMPPTQQTVWTSSTSSESLSAVSLSDKLPSELLLLYIITSLELRQWFESWKKLQDKWLSSSLTGVHPGTMINRIKQFRRRLGYASSRLLRLSSVLLQTLPMESSQQNDEDEDKKECASFAKKDVELMRVFDSNIEEMLNCNRIFQAITGGAFSEARWAAMNQLLNVRSGPNGVTGGSHLTLKIMKEKCGPGQIESFLEVCDECIVEARLHMKLEQTRQRLARIEVRVEEVNYSVRCEGVAEALAQLDDIAVDLKLCLFGQNPELQLCLELRADLERKVAVCEHILSYQKHWRLRCEATKLHEVDEFFSKRFSGGGGDFALPRARKSQQKAGIKQEQIVWQAFLDASHAWSDRLRRLFFVSPQQPQVEQVKTNQRLLLGRKSTVATASAPMALDRRLNTASKSMKCTLAGVMESFVDFDFEANFAACERGIELVHNYLESLREKTPRLYCLDETSMLRLLLRDSDIKQLHQSLANCFPRVHQFAVSRAANRVGSTIEVFGRPESGAPARSNKTIGTIVIVGVEGMYNNADLPEKSGHFRLPVAKIGRVKFWFSRLEEEMSLMVLADMKRAFEWITSDFDNSELGGYDSLLPQSIVTASGLRFTMDMNRALRSDQQETLCDQLHQLRLEVDGNLEGLVALRRAEKTASTSVRLETMILLNAMQAEVVCHIVKLLEQEQQEEALFFWSMQFQTRVFVEIISTPGSNVQPSPVKHGKVEKNELLPASSDFLKVSASNHNGQLTNMSVCCQVAHLQMPLGQEFVGWTRFAVLSPFTQRCSYALFSAMRMHHSALIVPYNASQTGTNPSSLLWGISQMLWRPCIEFSCDPSAGATTIQHLGNLMNSTSRLNGFLIVRHLLQLSAELIGIIQEQMLQHFHHTAPFGNFNAHSPQQAVTNSLVLSRHLGGLSYGASAIFIPLDSAEDLERSELVRSIRTQFRAVAVSRPAIKYVVKCMLIANGFMTEQIRQLNVVEAFEAIEAGEIGSICAVNVELLISRVVHEAQRLRQNYRVVWDSTEGGNATKAQFQTRQSSSVSSAVNKLEIYEEQCVFRQAFHLAIKTLLTEGDDVDKVNNLLTRVFPLSTGGRLVTKNKGDEEAVAAAVTIYLESVYALPANYQQFELIMELWRALQTFPAAMVYGPPACGKTTCITALHRALVALEMSERSQENEDGGRINNQPSSLTQLVILNPQLLSLDQFYSSVATACGAEDSNSSSLKWVLVDGEVDAGVLDRLLESDNRACSSASSLPSSSVLYRGQNSSILSGDCSDPSTSHRLLFEVTSLANLSPSVLRRCWALHVPAHCITTASIITTWRFRWENQLVFPLHTRGFEAMAAVFKTIDVLLSNICLSFVVEEANQNTTGDTAVETGALRLGYLSINNMTQTALTLVSRCCFQNKSLLQELSYLRLVELTAFAVLWGFAGHLPNPFKLKLENFVRVKSKEHSEIKHLAELPHGLLDANHFEDVWDELQPKFAAPLAVHPPTNGAKAEIMMQSAFDASSGQVLVLIPAAASLLRICTMLIYSSHSFLLIGPAASGKTSLLRRLVYRNRETEAAEMKIETSLDGRHVHGILDWTRVPAAWFQPLNQQDNDANSRAKMREESELFSGRSRHSFVFLDDLDASGEISSKVQMHFVRTMLDHRMGYSTKYGGFQTVEKHIGATMRLNESKRSLSPALTRFMRHFIVFRVPTYTQKELLSVFRVKFQRHFKADLSQVNTERRLSVKGGMGGGGQQLPLEEVLLRASIDFAVEIAAFQLLGQTEHPCLYLFNHHHVNTLLERTLVFAAGISVQRSEVTTLVQLGKAHQSWLSELQNIFLSNCPREFVNSQCVNAEGDDVQKKISTLLRNLSEKYFSVAFRGSSDHSFPISVETLHFLVKLAEHHVQAPLLQPRLTQLRELLNEHMTAANGVSRRASDQARATLSATNSISSPTELVSSILLEFAATSTSSDAGCGPGPGYYKTSRPYSSGQLTAFETKLLLSSSWCLTQVTHLIHALSQQQQIVLSSTSQHSRLLSDRLLRSACDLHGFKVHLIESSSGSHKQAIRVALGAAGVRQERVALWIREGQMSSDVFDIIQELCLGKLPSIALLPGGEELRDELVLSCIQSRKHLEIVTEAELLVEFQERLQYNFRLCILEENDGHQTDNGEAQGTQSSEFLCWMKTKPTCHWRRLEFTDIELHRLVPEVTKAALTSPALCGVSWDVQQITKYVVLCQNVHLHLMSASLVAVDPTSQLHYFLSFMTNVTVTYRAQLQNHQKKIVRLQTALETLAFVRNKVVPTLERLKQKFELQCTEIESELESFDLQQETKEHQGSGLTNQDEFATVEAPVVEEDRWILHTRYEELLMMNCETELRLEEVLKFLAEWHHVAERMNDLFTKWTQELDREKSKTEHEIMDFAIYGSAQRVYPYVTSLSVAKRNTCWMMLRDLIVEDIEGDKSPGIDAMIDDESVGVVRLIWTSRFSFFRDPEIYRIVRLADELSDRVPVLVDPSGVLQRFLVHIFSGHTLFSSLPGCGGAGDVDSENPNTSKESMVISCDDPKLEFYLQEAQRLGIPVLLVNFRSADHELVGRLQPFVGHARLSHAPPRRPLLHELTMKYYEDHRRQKQRRTSIGNSAMSSLTPTSATVTGGAVLMAKRAARAGRRPSVAIDLVSAMSTNSTVHGDQAKTRDARTNSNFQIYAFTATPVPAKVQHALTTQFAHFSVLLPDSEMKMMFELSRVGKTQQTLLQELREDQIGLADCWIKMIQNRNQLDQLLETLKPTINRDDSPFARRLNQGVTIHLQERYSELASQFMNDHQAELVQSSREQKLEQKYEELALAAEAFAPTANRLVGVARCMATMSSSLSIGTRTSPFYLQSVHYLENAAAQQVTVQGDDAVQLSVGGVKALMTRISSGFVSNSHCQIFCFLESIQQQIQTRRSSRGGKLELPAWNEALVWLVTSCVHRSRLKESSLDLLDADKRQGLGIFPGRRNSLKWSGDSGASLVERLRRRVKLCAYLFNGWRASRVSKNARSKSIKASTAINMQTGDVDGAETKELAGDKLQQQIDKLLADSENLWYEWKTTRVRMQMDVERIIGDLGYQDTPTFTSVERNNTILSSAITLITLEELSSRFKFDTTTGDEYSQQLVPLLLAKTLFPSNFAQVLEHYLQMHGSCSTCELDSGSPSSDEPWTVWASPASLVADFAPPRGKHTRAHLPRSLILYIPEECSNVELKLSSWGIAVFTNVDNVALKEELIMLITTKHKFVLELLDPQPAEAALGLVSQLINEHALLSVPEWYLLVSFSVATAIESGKLAVMDRIAVYSPSSLSRLDFVDRDRGGTTEQIVMRKLMEEYGVSGSVASALTLAVLNNHKQDHSNGIIERDSVVRDLKDVVVHFLSIDEVAMDVLEREQMTKRLLRLVTKSKDHDDDETSRNNAVAMLSSELLSDLLSVGDSSLSMLTEEPEDEWLPRYSINDGEASCERLWTSLCQVGELFKSLQASNDSNADANEVAQFFPWLSFDFELTNQFSAFKALEKHLTRLRTWRNTASSNLQQQLSSLARGYVPFEWIESFFSGTAWPSRASGTVSIAQFLLLVAYRVGVLVCCLRGARAWALNLAVVNDACNFLACLRSYTAARTNLSESSLMLVLELDSSSDATDPKNEQNEKKKKTLAIAKQFGALCGESDWHGAVLHHVDGGVEWWGIRVEGLVLVEQTSTTKLHPLPMCRITCQPCIETTEVPVLLLPSLSPYQPASTIFQELKTNCSVRVVLGRSVDSVVDMIENSETKQYAIGVPVFPDDDSNDSNS